MESPESKPATQRVLELTLLHLKPGIEPNDPGLLKSLQDVRRQLETDSRFFITNDSRPSPGEQIPPIELFILGLWPSVRDHDLFLNSESKDLILGPQEKYTEFQWTVHLETVSNMDELRAPKLRIESFIALESTASRIETLARKYNGKTGSPPETILEEVVPEEGGKVERLWLLSDAEVWYDVSQGDELVRKSRKTWCVENLEKITERG